MDAQASTLVIPMDFRVFSSKSSPYTDFMFSPFLQNSLDIFVAYSSR